MRVLVADRDERVRRALSGLFEAAGARVVGVTSGARLVPNLDARLDPDIVVLELSPRQDEEASRWSLSWCAVAAR